MVLPKTRGAGRGLRRPADEDLEVLMSESIFSGAAGGATARNGHLHRLALAVVAITEMMSVPSARAAPAPVVSQAAPPAGEVFPQHTGEELFRATCQGCHMSDARGATGAGSYPSLAGNPKLAAGAYLAAVVISGQRAMPPLGRYLSDEQVAAVVNYVRSHFGNDFKDSVSAADVAALRRNGSR